MGNNLNILADLEAKEQEFISVRELFERIRLHNLMLLMQK